MKRTIRNIAMCIAAAALLLSCEKKPKTIPQHEFSVLLADLYLEDGYLETRPSLRAQTDSLFIYKPVIESHGYSMTEYYNTLDYYISDFAAWEKMMADVKAILQQRKSIVDPLAEIYMAERGMGGGSLFPARSIWIGQTINMGTVFDDDFMHRFYDTTYVHPLHFYQELPGGMVMRNGSAPMPNTRIPAVPPSQIHHSEDDIKAALSGKVPSTLPPRNNPEGVAPASNQNPDNEINTLKIPSYLRRKAD
jgi:hypothetical protein